MKKILTLIIIALVVFSQAYAEQVDPNLLVKGLIESAQRNDLEGIEVVADLAEIASTPRHAKSLDQLILFLKSIDVNKIKFQEINQRIGDDRILVRIVEPISYDFELERQPTKEGKPIFIYRIVSVHP